MTKAGKILSAVIVTVMALTAAPFAVYGDTEPSNDYGAYGQGEPAVQEEPAEGIAEEPADGDGQEEPDEPGEPADPDDPAEPDDPQPAVPEITVAMKGPALAVSWKQIPDADYYEVYRSYSSGSKGTKIKKVTGALSYSDKDVASGKKAYYRVRAHMKDGTFTDYSEVASNVIYRVYIETGHGTDSRGRWDPGCRWGKYQEAKLMIPICKSMAKYLRKKGIYVYTDAEKGNNRNLNWLMKNLKSYNVSVLVNVHCDYSKAPRGTLPLYRYSEQKKLAKCLNTGVHKTVKIKNRGLKKRKDLSTLNKTKSYCVACLFETGNIKRDNKILRTKYDAYGKGLAMGVCSYLGIKW